MKYLLAYIILCVLLIVLLPNTQKQQFSYASGIYPEDHHDFFNEIRETNIVDFTHRKDVIFVCHASREMTATASATRFAREHGLKFNYFVDWLGSWSSRTQFYLVDKNGDTEIVSFEDNRRIAFDQRDLKSDNVFAISKSGNNKCNYNTKPILTYYDDT